jgi:DNA-binding transcriptional MerR regulator
MAVSEDGRAGAENGPVTALPNEAAPNPQTDPVENGRLRPTGKSQAAFRTISEVSSDLDVPQHVLRFWESKFTQLRPLKRGGGRRYYRPEDIALLRRIHSLLYREGYTIKGVQQVLRNGRRVETVAVEPQPGTPAAAGPQPQAEPAALDGPVAEPTIPGLGQPPSKANRLLTELLAELKQLRSLLD